MEINICQTQWVVDNNYLNIEVTQYMVCGNVGNMRSILLVWLDFCYFGLDFDS